jgi:hypothetical protein
MGANEGRLSRDELVESRRAGTKALFHPTEIVDSIVEALGQAQSAVGIGVDGSLKCAEKAPRPRNGNCHRPELAEKLVPGLEGEALLSGMNLGKNIAKTLLTTLWEFQSHGNGVNNKAEDFLT